MALERRLPTMPSVCRDAWTTKNSHRDGGPSTCTMKFRITWAREVQCNSIRNSSSTWERSSPPVGVSVGFTLKGKIHTNDFLRREDWGSPGGAPVQLVSVGFTLKGKNHTRVAVGCGSRLLPKNSVAFGGHTSPILRRQNHCPSKEHMSLRRRSRSKAVRLFCED